MAIFPSVQSNPRFSFPNGGTGTSTPPNQVSRQTQTPCSNFNNIPLQHTSAYLASPPSTPPRGRSHPTSIKGTLHRHSKSLVVTPKCSILNLQQPTPPNTNTYPPPLHLLTTPSRAKPTLAMSFTHRQRSVSPSRIYAPTPASPTPRSISHSSNHIDIARPPSRSERLLRDTLKRDEAERHAVPALPASQYSRPQKQQPRPSKSASVCGRKEEDEDPWMRGSFHFDDGPGGAHLVRNKSTGNVRRSEPPPQSRHPHNTNPHNTNTRRQTSPSPIRHQLTRSPNSMPSTTPHTTSNSGVASQARSRSHSHSQSMGSLPAAACALTPHEAVLRSRLEKVLSMGRDEAERETMRRERHDHEWLGQECTSSPSSADSGSYSLQHSPYSNTSPLPSPTYHAGTAAPNSTPTRKHKHQHPITPPDSPPSPFNARTAAAHCRAMEGYVSFANVEGLGEPASGVDEEDEPGPGGLKSGFERLWRVWGREREA